MGYLDTHGLHTLWGIIKTLVNNHRAVVIPAAQSGVIIADVDGTTIYSPPVHSSTSVTLNSSSWVNNELTISVSGVTATNDVVVTPAPSNMRMWSSCGVYCSEQGADTLTFVCSTTPEVNLVANILIFL